MSKNWTTPHLSRRQILTTAPAVVGAAALLPASASAAGSKPPARLTLRWWGNNSWQLRSPDATVLIDPWLTRFPTGTYAPEGADPDTPLSVDSALLDEVVGPADQILVTHGHYDHLPDVPHIAKATGATVLGTESHCHTLHALGTPPQQLSVVTGGEFLSFGQHRIEVIRSLHSASGPRRQVAFPGTNPGYRPLQPPPPAPTKISELIEGGTLAYEVTIGGRTVLNLGGSNFIAKELAGRRPDVLLLPAGGLDVVDYVPRLLRLLGHPRYVLPTHWDDFDQPYGAPAVDAGGLAPLVEAVHSASPAAKVVVLEHGQTFRPR